MNGKENPKSIVVFYATCEGQTRRIGEHIVATVRSRGRSADVIDVANAPEPVTLDGYVRRAPRPPGDWEALDRFVGDLLDPLGASV